MSDGSDSEVTTYHELNYFDYFLPFLQLSVSRNLLKTYFIVALLSKCSIDFSPHESTFYNSVDQPG